MTPQPPDGGGEEGFSQMPVSEMTVLSSLSLDCPSEEGFSRAVDVLTRQTHVLNRRVAAAVIWPLADQTAHQSGDAANLVPGDANNGGSPLIDVTSGHSPPHNATNGYSTSTPDVTNGHTPPYDVTNGHGTSPADVTNGSSPSGDVPSGAPLPAEVSRLLRARLGAGSAAVADCGAVAAAVADCGAVAAAVADCGAVAAVCGGGEAAGRRLAVRKVVPRQTGAEAEWDLVITDRLGVSFIPLQDGSRLLPPFPHRLQLSPGRVGLLAPPGAVGAPSARWLSEHVLPKVARWTLDMAADSARPPPEGSLQLVNTESYNTLYKQLKAKYGAEFVKIWPENTDPLKFVHEDVAIASYLLLLWEEDRRRRQLPRRQSFVDVGCGNGLLVHILNSEGHPGYGVDIRSRVIWQLYPETTRLKVETVTPSADTTYPGSDWLIGNHSDELTPWIPVMAAATGPETSFFLLPCCPWDFYSKYQRTDTRLSQYEEYLRYVFRLSERCGFLPERDRLRIPSTRRRCVVGRRRATATADLRSLTTGAAQFRPRAALPPVRNCTQLPGDTAAVAVRQVALRLAGDGIGGAVGGIDGAAGLPLPAVATLLGRETLVRLKQQCGGLKTLLRNHPAVFAVRGDRVTLTGADWLRADPGRPELAASLKTSRCWQHDHLPAGCPLPADQCRYAHGEQELRHRPARTHSGLALG